MVLAIDAKKVFNMFNELRHYKLLLEKQVFLRFRSVN